jgi:hypothetical protein
MNARSELRRINGECEGDSLSASAKYPSYKSFDDFVDVPRLRSLDAYISDRLRRHILTGSDDYFMNQHCLDLDSPHKPGVREVWLTRTVPGTPYDYLDINRTDLWQESAPAAEFALLMDFIKDLPFESRGRILLIYDEGGRSVPAHRDHENQSICHEFVWLRTNLRKPFYLFNQLTGEKVYVSGYSAWFDTVNQYHGSDSADGLTFSIRVDGHFKEEFKRQIPYFRSSLAATPAVWAMGNGDI